MRTFLRIGLSMVIAFAGAHSYARQAIPIVHTWGDLQAAPTLTVVPSLRPRNGEPPPVLPPVTFRVGINSDRAATGGSLVFYFLAPSAPEERDTPGERGLYTILAEGRQYAYVDQGSAEYPKLDHPPAGTTFYAVSIPFTKAGDYVVKLIRQSYDTSIQPPPLQVYAEIPVHVLDSPGELWYPLWETEAANGGGAKQGKDPEGQYFAIVPMSNPKGGAAVPTPQRPRTYAQLPSPEKKLPTLFPAASMPPRVGLKMSDTTLSVFLPQQIEGFYPEDSILTRWWINGKPVALDPLLEPPGQMRALAAEVHFSNLFPTGLYGALVWYTKQIHFDLHFKPDWLSVKKGDKIGLQLLFCPGGVTALSAVRSESMSEVNEAQSEPPPDSLSEISNRIEFTYSGDPAHPQQ